MSPAKTIRSEFLTWVCGLHFSKSSYPEPWASAPESVFSKARTRGTERVITASAGTIIGRNQIRAIHELRSGKHYAAIKDNTIIFEYHSSKPGVVEVVTFNLSTSKLAARSFNFGDSGEEIPGGMDVCFRKSAVDTSAASCSGVSVFIVLLLAELAYDEGTVPLKPAYTGECADCIKKLLRLKEKDELGEYGMETFFGFAHYTYTMLKAGSWLGDRLNGYSDDAYFSRLSVEDIVELATGSRPFALSSMLSDRAAAAVKEMSFLHHRDTYLFTDGKDDGWYDESGREKGKHPVSDAVESLAKELKLDIHPLSEAEMDMIPTMDGHYVVDERLKKAARTIKRDWKHPYIQLAPNFILEGDAGSGKTAGSRFFAAVFGMPYTKMTMNPMFESANLIGAFYPVFDDMDKWSLDAADNDALQKVASQMSISHATADAMKEIRCAFEKAEMRDIVRAAYGIPDRFECELMPDAAWARLGCVGESPDAADVVEAADRIAKDKFIRLFNYMIDKAEQNQVSYRFQISELMKAFQFGWLVEIQEAASVLRPGVLTELNSLLEVNGRIELPNGKFITRHPDTIVIITTNRDYAGNVDLNESLRDRCLFGIKMDVPPAEVMAARAMAQTGFSDKDIAMQAAKTILNIGMEAKARNIRGSFGMRSLLAWMLDLQNGDFSEEAFLQRVVYKMTTRDDDVAILLTCYRANCSFASKTAKRDRSA